MGANQTIRIDVIARANTQPIRQMKREIRSLGSTAKAAATGTVGGLAVLGKASQAAGTALIAGVGVGLALSAKAAIDFESSFAGVRKTVDASESQFDALKTTLKDLSLDIPVNVNELARIAELGGQLGVGLGGLEGFTETIAKLAATTNLDIDEAATTMARFTNIMGTSDKDFERVASGIVELGNNFATTESEILTFGTRLAGIGATVGGSEADVLGLSAAFVDLGVRAERGATAVQRTLIGMFTAVSSGGPKLEAFAEVAGVTADEFARMFETDPFGAFVQFERGLGLIIDSGGDAAAILKALGLGAQRTLSTLLVGANAPEKLASGIDMATVAMEENVALTEEAEKRFETTASKIQILANAFQVLAINMGDATLGPITEIVERMGGFVEVFGESSEVIDKFIIAAGALLAARIFVRLGTGLSKLITKLGFITSSDSIFLGGARLTRIFGGLGTAVKLAGGFVGALAAIFGLYLVVAGNARAKTNKLTEAVERLNEVLADPESSTEDRFKSFEEALLKGTITGAGTIFSQIADNDTGRANLRETQNILRKYKVSWEDFVNAALDGGLQFNAIEEDVLGQVFGIREAIREEARTKGITTGLIASEKEVEEEITLLTELFNKTRQVFQIGKDLRSEADREAALASPFTLEQELAALRGNIDSINGIIEQAPEESLLDFVSEAIGDDADGAKAEKMIESFNENIAEFGEDFLDTWNDVIGGFVDLLTDWESVWDEYVTVVAPSVDKILDNMAKLNVDNEKWIALQKHIFATYSHDYRVFWLGLEEETQRGLAAMDPDDFQTTFEAMFAFDQLQQFQALESGLAVMETVLLETISTKWPPKLREALADAEKLGWAPGMAEWNLLMGEAIDDMIADVHLDNPVLAAELQRFMEAAVDQGFLFDEDLFGAAMDILMADLTSAERSLAFAELGIGWALDTAGGYAALIALMRGVATEAAQSVPDAIDRVLQNRSPSKVMMKIGENAAEGFRLGMGDMGMGNVSEMIQSLSHVSTSPSITNNRGGDTFVINGNELSESIRLAGTLAGITRRMETKVGK